MRLLKLKGLVWDFWNLKDHFGKNEKLKGHLDAFDLYDEYGEGKIKMLI